jgi:hypothetical protein
MRDAILQTASLRGSSTENKNATVLTKGVQRRFLPVTLLHPVPFHITLHLPVTLFLFFPITLLLPVTRLLSVPVPIALLLPVLLPLPVTYMISFVRE